MHPDFNQPIAYVALEGEREFEIVLNTRDAEAPWAIHLIDGRYAERVRWIQQPGQPPLIPTDWQPVPGLTRRIVTASEEWAWKYAHEMALTLWPQVKRDHDDQAHLTAVIFNGLMNEVQRGGPALETIPEEEAMPKDTDRDRSAITGQYVTDAYADEHPDTTVSEQAKPTGRRAKDTPLDAPSETRPRETGGPESGPAPEEEDA